MSSRICLSGQAWRGNGMDGRTWPGAEVIKGAKPGKNTFPFPRRRGIVSLAAPQSA